MRFDPGLEPHLKGLGGFEVGIRGGITAQIPRLPAFKVREFTAIAVEAFYTWLAFSRHGVIVPPYYFP